MYVLLARLSKTTQSYLSKHREVLQNTLIKLSLRKLPSLVLDEEYKGDKGKVKAFQWPSDRLIHRLSRSNVPFSEIGISFADYYTDYSDLIVGIKTSPPVKSMQVEESERSTMAGRYADTTLRA